jgi:hypothetical protein
MAAIKAGLVRLNDEDAIFMLDEYYILGIYKN